MILTYSKSYASQSTQCAGYVMTLMLLCTFAVVGLKGHFLKLLETYWLTTELLVPLLHTQLFKLLILQKRRFKLLCSGLLVL